MIEDLHTVLCGSSIRAYDVGRCSFGYLGITNSCSIGEIFDKRTKHRVFLKGGWSKIRSGKYDFVLKYKNEKGEEITEAVTKFSAGLILAIINTKDGSREEFFLRKLEMRTVEKEKETGTKKMKMEEVTSRWRHAERRKEAENEVLNLNIHEIEVKAASEYPFLVIMVPRNVHYSSDSSYLESFSVSDSDSKDIAEEDSELITPEFEAKTDGDANSTKDRVQFQPSVIFDDDKTPAEPKE
ncbi:hypothetical protein OROMI_005734 [Orobanche minor]